MGNNDTNIESLHILSPQCIVWCALATCVSCTTHEPMMQHSMYNIWINDTTFYVQYLNQ